MLERYIYTLTRLRYLQAAMQNIPTFKPDGKDLIYVSEQVLLCSGAGDEFQLKYNAYNSAIGALNAEVDSSHDASVMVYACMKSCYRTDPTCSAAIVRLPKQDRSGESTLRRMRGIMACWSTLPNVPGTTQPFAVGPWTQAAFGTKSSTLESKLMAADLARSVYSGAIATLNQKDDAWNNLVTAALIQGRAMYPEGTPERAYIDRIPTEPSQQDPEQAVITLAASPAVGAVHLEFTAGRATSYEVWHKGPGQPVFEKVADVLAPGIYDATGVSGGPNQYQIVGENSRGTGPASTPVTVQVLLANVA